MKRLITLFLLVFSTVNTGEYNNNEITIETAWGKEIISDQCALDLINTSLMQRLKDIDQSGPQRYFGIVPSFSRFDHSVGVYALLCKAGVSHQEQIAGLLHDASHTAFSHLADFLFGNGDGHKSYQDGIHLEYLSSYDDVKAVLDNYGYLIEDMDPDKEEYTALERSLPDLCADRIQYIIHTGVLLKYITPDQAHEIVENLHFKDGIWYFTDKRVAADFASISLRCTQSLWGDVLNAFFYLLFKHILLRAIELQLITRDDLHYSTDTHILNIIQASSDDYIQRLLSYTTCPYKWYTVVGYNESDIHYKIKFRGVDPLILTNGSLQRLTLVDSVYATEYESVKKWCQEGYGIKLLVDIESEKIY